MVHSLSLSLPPSLRSASLSCAQSSGSASVTCSNEYINPLSLEGDFIDEGDEEGGDPTVGMGTGRRKKRSTVKRTLRNKRQEIPIEQGLSENITLVSSLKMWWLWCYSSSFSFLRVAYHQNLMLWSTVSTSDVISLDLLVPVVYKWTSTLAWMRDSFQWDNIKFNLSLTYRQYFCRQTTIITS